MAINIKQNDYVQPTEIRDYVVQGICDSFLNECDYHPRQEGYYRHATPYIWRSKPDGTFDKFRTDFVNNEKIETIKFNGAEMKQAFKELINAGYFMFKVYKYGTWLTYRCSKKPELFGYTQSRYSRVTEFNEFID